LHEDEKLLVKVKELG